MGKARLDMIARSPEDRGKPCARRGLCVYPQAGHLSIAVAAAKAHDAKMVELALEAIVVGQPQPIKKEFQNLCLDKGYESIPGRDASVYVG